MAKTPCVRIRSPHTNTSPLPPTTSQTREHLDPNEARFPGMAGRKGASPRGDEDNKGKRAAGGELGKRGLGWAGKNGTTAGWAPGTKAPAPPQLPAGAGGGEGLLQGRPKAAATRALPARLPGPGARGPAGASGAGSPP